MIGLFYKIYAFLILGSFVSVLMTLTIVFILKGSLFLFVLSFMSMVNAAYLISIPIINRLETGSCFR